MRYHPNIFEKVKSGSFFGNNRPNGRVTVEPLWQLSKTPSRYGNSYRGPYRWFQDLADTGIEWEVPNIKSIAWDRSESQDLASCTITLYNMWHEANTSTPELAGQLGKPGYFWPKRGLELNRWGQIEGTGSFRKDGFWDPNFSWKNILVPYALLRTYEGYGGHPTESNYQSVQDNLDNENVLLTGTWLIKSISASSAGEMTLSCVDMGKLLLDQICFPPTIPDSLYPLEYYPEGKTAFDSVWGPTPKAGVSAGSQGEVRSVYSYSSLDDIFGPNTIVDGHTGKHANDGNWQTFAISNSAETPEEFVWFEFDIHQPISKLNIKPWAGGYECYISFKNAAGTAWIGTEDIPNYTAGTPPKYVKKVNFALHQPDNQEDALMIELPTNILTNGTVNVSKLRLTFNNLYYYGGSDPHKYRAGIRDLILYREGNKVDPYIMDFSALPATLCMTTHPTRGYWIVDEDGTVHGFGDAADYDSTAFGPVPLSSATDSLGSGPHLTWWAAHPNKAVGITAHPDGKGYWVLDEVGNVYAYGSASYHGHFLVPFTSVPIWGYDTVQARGIAATYTGNGYWVVYSDGTVKGFGDAAGIGPSGDRVRSTGLSDYLTAADARYDYQGRACNITSHPKKLGFWVVSRAGEVFNYGDTQDYSGLTNLTYHPGLSDSWVMAAPIVSSIESTSSGNGYWICTFDGHIGGFGDATGKGPNAVYPVVDLGLDVVYDDAKAAIDDDFSFFRALIWDIAKDPDGTGFWVLVADGSVKSYDAEFWGQPSYTGMSGWRWHEGNFNGEWSQIMKELCLWAGFTFYDPSLGLDMPPSLFGEIETTGIYTDTTVPPDMFDKKPLLDIIKQLCEVVAYRFSIREDGGIKISSSNIWRSGNFDEDGVRIYVDSGTYNRVDPDDIGAIPFVPVIDETVDMFSYSSTLDSESMRSEIIIGTESPDPKNPSTTHYIRYTPRSGSEEEIPGIKSLRGIPRVGIWISQLFTNPEEMMLMAELISLMAWFGERNSSTSCVANPCLSVGDQIKIYERFTSESYNHYISGINSNNDLDNGTWNYTLTTHWLGDSDNWVITANAHPGLDPERHIEISERLDRWQFKTGKGLEKGNAAKGSNSDIMLIFGNFDKKVYQIGDDDWILNGTISLSKRTTLSLTLKDLSAPLGSPISISIYEGGNLILNNSFSYQNETITMGPLGHDNENTLFTFTMTATQKSTGNGLLSVSITDSDSSGSVSFRDTALILSEPTVLGE